MPEPFVKTPKQVELCEMLGGPALWNLAEGGSRCLAPDTILDGQTKTVEELAAIGAPIVVKTSEGWIQASAPHCSGYGDMLTVTTASGHRQTVTPGHRFWTRQGWKRLDELQAGDSIGFLSYDSPQESAPGPQESSSGLCPPESPAGALRSNGTVEGYPESYCTCHHQHDERLQRIIVSGPAYPASSSDATGRIPGCDRNAGLESGSHTAHQLPPEEVYTPICQLSPEPCREVSALLEELESRYGVRISEPSRETLLSTFQSPGKSVPDATARPPVRTAQGTSAPVSELGAGFECCASTTPRHECIPRLLQSLRQSLPADTDALLYPSQTLVSAFCAPVVYSPIVSIAPSTPSKYYTLHVPIVNHYTVNNCLNHNSGKTLCLLRAIALRMLKAPGSTHCVIRRTFKDVKQKIGLTSFPQMMRKCFPQIEYNVNRADWYIDVDTGAEPSRIWLAGLDDVAERDDRILGHEFSTLYFNEATEITYSSVTTAMTRLAEQNCLMKKLYFDCNPGHRKHWLYTLFHLGLDPVSKTKLDPETYASMRLNPIDNMANLDSFYMNILKSLPAQKRKRFEAGEWAEDEDGKMWKREWIDNNRVIEKPPLRRIVIAVDPAVTANAESDDTGVVVAGIGYDKHFYVVEDATLAAASPATWAKHVKALYDEHRADLVVAEVNQGGDLVAANLHNIDPHMPVEVIRASRGKALRAEPITHLYERGLVHHINAMVELEDEMVYFDPEKNQRSPGRMDSLVYALAELAGTTVIDPMVLTPDEINEYLLKQAAADAEEQAKSAEDEAKAAAEYEMSLINNEAVWS